VRPSERRWTPRDGTRAAPSRRVGPDTVNERARERTILLIASALLVAAVAAVYAPVRDAGFVNLDDVGYITTNPAVRGGLTLAGLRHVAFHAWAGLWMPLTFASHMLDVTVFGADPSGPHLVNVALHAANVVLLLLLLVRTTDAVAPSIVVAALFALHPLRVES